MQTISRFNGVKSVVNPTGRYDILVEVFFNSREELRSFLVEDINKVGGILSSETFIFLDAINNWVEFFWKRLIFWNDPQNPEKPCKKTPDSSGMKLPKRALPLKPAAIPLFPSCWEMPNWLSKWQPNCWMKEFTRWGSSIRWSLKARPASAFRSRPRIRERTWNLRWRSLSKSGKSWQWLGKKINEWIPFLHKTILDRIYRIDRISVECLKCAIADYKSNRSCWKHVPQF